MRKFAVAIAILIVLLVVIGIAVPLLVPSSAIKDRLIAAASDGLGRAVTIDGPVRVALFPRLRLEAEAVSIANAPGAGSAPMAKLAMLAVDLELLPLLTGTVSIDRLELVDPVVALQVDAKGQPNWTFGASSGGGPPKRLRLVNGKVTYTDRRSGKTETAEAIDLDLAQPVPDAPVAIEGALVWNGQKASLKLTLDTSGAKPVLGGQLGLDRLDLSSKPAKPVSGWSDEPIDLSALKLADADLALSLGSLTTGRFTLGQSQLAVTVKDGKLAADLKQVALYQGSGTGRVTLDAGGVLALDAKLSHVAAQPFLKGAIDFNRVSGTGDFDLSLTSRGLSERALIAGLGGKASFTLADGAVHGADLGGMFKNIAESFLDAASGKAAQTNFSRLTGTLTAEKGIVRNRDLALKAPGLDVTGNGMIDLPPRRIDYRLTPHLVDQSDITVPVLIQGDLDTPDYKPDLTGVLKDVGDKSDGLLKDLFGK